MIKDLHRRLAERGGEAAPRAAAPSGKCVAIVGAGAAGLAAAWVLLHHGHECHLYDKRERAGGPLNDLDEDELPREVLDAEVAEILQLGATLQTNCEIGKDFPREELASHFDAVLLACDDLDDDEPNVFSAVEFPMAVSAVADGRDGAMEVDRFLRGLPENEPPSKPFDCRLGPLDDSEKAAFAANRADPGALEQGRQPENMEDEAKRCLHCDCAKVVSCKLRQYATEYGAKQFVYPGVERPPVDAVQLSSEIVFDHGKCIKCGLCVAIAERRGEALGMTFTGRGIEGRVRVPFGKSLEDGLRISGRECAAACPTGALALRNLEERDP